MFTKNGLPKCANSKISDYKECPIFLDFAQSRVSQWRNQINQVISSFEDELNQNVKNPCSNVTTKGTSLDKNIIIYIVGIDSNLDSRPRKKVHFKLMHRIQNLLGLQV